MKYTQFGVSTGKMLYFILLLPMETQGDDCVKGSMLIQALAQTPRKKPF